ncbi:MAG: YesL family protein [Lachnospiraceae bacterium]|nr:YesL family protein [Lachnospiraceae bacterium]
MVHLFDPDNKFWRSIGKFFDAILMGFMWLLFSLPIVTIGAATASFYQFTLRQVNDTEGTIISSFTKYFFKRFKKATVIWLIQLAACLFLAFDFWICWEMIDWSAGFDLLKLVFVGLVAISLIVLAATVYVYPILALFDFGVKKTICDSFIMAIANLPVTVTVWVMYAAVLFVFDRYTLLTPVAFSLMVFFSSYFIFTVFNKYAVDDEEEEMAEFAETGQIGGSGEKTDEQ